MSDALTRLIGLYTLLLIQIICRGAVLYVMWGWFFVPQGLPKLSIPFLLGISLTLRAITTVDTADLNSEDKDIGTMTAVNIMYSAILLGIAWVIHLFC